MRKGFLNDWINREEKAQVALLSAPVTFPPTPSVALSIFKSALDEAGISSKVIYAMFPTIHMIDKKAIYRISRYIPLQENAEYLFAHLTDIPGGVPIDEFVRIFTPPDLLEETVDELTELLSQTMSMAEEIVEAVALRIVSMGAGIVAASSVHRQQIASLAILKRVKDLNPSIRTILGGHNVSGEMGLAILRNFPSVDYVSFGEGDETIAEVCSNLLAGGNRPMPYGIVGRDGPLPKTAPFRMTKDMDGIALPDYRDFFEEVQMEEDGFYGGAMAYPAQARKQNRLLERPRNQGLERRRAPLRERTVFLEGSRGCWWAAKHPCSFCSMNGLNNAYREKTPERLYSEIRRMTQQYPGAHIHLCDNMMSGRMLRGLLPLLVEDEVAYSLFAEIRTNHGPEEIQALSEAGFHEVQPGIESLNDHLLALMGKGSSGIQNIALLKYCTTYRVFPSWKMMAKIPGENREDYEQMMDIMQLLSHLYPPLKVIYIAFMRFSRYGERPEDYGLELQPDPLCRCCFADRPDISDNIGVYYDLTGGPFADTMRENEDLYNRLRETVREWNRRFNSAEPPVLLMTETESGISIHDTRACAEEERCLLSGLHAEIYRLAWEPISPAALLERLPEPSEKDVKGILDDLIARKLMLFLSGKYLALAVLNESQESQERPATPATHSEEEGA